jgi:hypothetical protein
MASTNNDKEKTPSEDDHQDLKLKEEVESEAEGKEIEEDQRLCPHAIVGSIGVVTSPSKFKKSARISTGGGVPRHHLAPRTSSSGNNPFHTLIHKCLLQQFGTALTCLVWKIARTPLLVVDRNNHLSKQFLSLFYK